VPNFIKIGQTVAETWRFNGFQNGGRTHSQDMTYNQKFRERSLDPDHAPLWNGLQSAGWNLLCSTCVPNLYQCLQCYGAVGWAAGSASGL